MARFNDLQQKSKLREFHRIQQLKKTISQQYKMASQEFFPDYEQENVDK